MNTKDEDFQALKEYVENLSHELLTPLSVIRNEAELLLQSSNLSESDYNSVGNIVQTVNRLYRVNKGLILMSKINEGIYIDQQQVNLDRLIESLLYQFSSQIETKDVSVETFFEEDVTITTNATLFEILLSNALKNAIVHNVKKGFVCIRVTPSKITIENSGNPLNVDTSQLFARFKSGRVTRNTIGLGLSIMKRACDHLKYKIDYQTNGEVHKLIIQYN